MQKKYKYDIFISYSRKDKEIVNRIVNALKVADISYFIDYKDIDAFTIFPETLANAILESRIVLFIASENSYASFFTTNEITFAGKNKKKILPYIVDNSTLPKSLDLVLASINWKNMLTCPIKPNLINEIKSLLGKPDSILKNQRLHSIFFNLETNKYNVSDGNPFSFGKDRYGFCDGRGNIVIDCDWCSVSEFNDDGIAVVHDDRFRYGIIDKTGQLIVQCKWKSISEFHEGLAIVRDDRDRCGFIDKTGKLVSQCKWLDAKPFSEGLAAVKNETEKWGFIDKFGNVQILCLWDETFSFSEGLGLVKKNYKHGYIDRLGRVVIKPYWNEASRFVNGYAPVVKNESYGWIDQIGNMVIHCDVIAI